MGRHFARPHLGKTPLKYYFRADNIEVSLPGIDVSGKLVVTWKRGHRKTSTDAFAVREELSNIDGSISRTATTLEDLCIICTMFKTRSGSMEQKLANFSIKEELADGTERKLCSADLDLSAYATPDLSSDKVEIILLDGKVILRLSLQSHWLKNVRGADDDDTMSTHSFGSYTSSAHDDEASDKLSELSYSQRPARGAGSSSASAGAGPSSSAEAYLPMRASERERANAQRTAAIEQRWAEEEGKARESEELEAVKEELRQARDKLGHSRDEVKYLRARIERMTAENRVLRRAHRAGNRDDVALQLEVELQLKEQERAEMEESLSAAFGNVIKEMQERINALCAERDRRLVQREGGGGSRFR